MHILSLFKSLQAIWKLFLTLNCIRYSDLPLVHKGGGGSMESPLHFKKMVFFCHPVVMCSCILTTKESRKKNRSFWIKINRFFREWEWRQKHIKTSFERYSRSRVTIKSIYHYKVIRRRQNMKLTKIVSPSPEKKSDTHADISVETDHY